MNTRAEIEQAIADYLSGELTSLTLRLGGARVPEQCRQAGERR
jgi:hypothetical protein